MKFTCDICQAEFDDWRSFSDHYYNEHKLRPCNFCDQKFGTLIKLSNHQAEAHQQRPCHICGRSAFNSWSTLSRHHRDVHHRRMITEGPNRGGWTYDNTPTERCEICGIDFCARKTYSDHMHNKHEKPHRCTMCDYRTGQRSELVKHMRLVHKEGSTPEEPPRKRARLDVDNVADAAAMPPPRQPSTSDGAADQSNGPEPAGQYFRYQCSMCDYKAVKTSHMEYHVRLAHRKGQNGDDMDPNVPSSSHATNSNEQPTTRTNDNNGPSGERADNAGDGEVSPFEKGISIPHPEVRKHYELGLERVRTHDFGTKFMDLRATFNGLEHYPLPKALLTLKQILENIIAVLTRGTSQYDLIQFILQLDQLQHPIQVQFVTVKEASVWLIMDAIERVLQSYQQFRIDGKVKVSFVHQPIPRQIGGWYQLGAMTNRKEARLVRFLSKKQSIINVRNREDGLCLARCLAIGKRIADGTYVHNFNVSAQCTKEANELHENCSVPKGPCDWTEIRQFCEHPTFADYMINVYEAERMAKRVHHTAVKEKTINILLFGSHCCCIKSMEGFKNRSYWCWACDASYCHPGEHKCE